MSHSVITPANLGKLLSGNKDISLVDVRTPAEFVEVHVRGAVNVPLDQLAPEKLPSRSEDEPLYVICHLGGRSTTACLKLAGAGLQNLINVEGGTDACERAGLPVVRGKKTMSLERQVRIVAGSLMLLGLGLSFLHPAFLAFSAFVGAGLIFAGVTDTCAMGLLLARMPWNQADVSCCATTREVPSTTPSSCGI